MAESTDILKHPDIFVSFLLGDSWASELYMPTFQNALFHLRRRIGMHAEPPMKTERSETSAYINRTPGNYPEESTQHSEQGESLKSGIHPDIVTI
jgi:hypothetical protein